MGEAEEQQEQGGVKQVSVDKQWEENAQAAPHLDESSSSPLGGGFSNLPSLKPYHW